MPIYTAILLAVVATSLMNFGMALQKRGAADLPRIGRERSGAVLRAFLLNRRWRRGMALIIGGWGLYLISRSIPAPAGRTRP